MGQLLYFVLQSNGAGSPVHLGLNRYSEHLSLLSDMCVILILSSFIFFNVANKKSVLGFFCLFDVELKLLLFSPVSSDLTTSCLRVFICRVFRSRVDGGVLSVSASLAAL